LNQNGIALVIPPEGWLWTFRKPTGHWSLLRSRGCLRRIGQWFDARIITAGTTAQIGADLGIAEGAVKSRLHHALRALQQTLQEMGVAP